MKSPIFTFRWTVVAEKSEIREDPKSEIEEIDAKSDRRARVDRHARASARTRIQSQGDDRVGRTRGGSRRIHHHCLHAEHVAGRRQSEHDRMDQRSRGGSRRA